MYTKKMHDSLRRQTKEKHNVVTNLLDEIDRLKKEMLDIPQKNFYHADRYDTDDKHVLHLWTDDENFFDIQVLKT